ncbi:Maf-like protein [Aquimarina brevivitae]|uniref:dTTP/UTP pyrophosphatase n=1 Tax=Aquimarina brevivitae TaxID=323412 RepID=A0A4Q7NU55_9FLAO|nr:Maf-like protein [Aquimarina brevivitae]RZS90721.1 septum formation protein [Aquimarina brevivitae]
MTRDFFADYEIILASGSPRRQQFFRDLGIPVTVDVRKVDEVFPEHLNGAAITDYLAKLKSEVFSDIQPNQIVITSDTIVWFQKKAMNKPGSHREAKEMIQRLSGHTHQVITSVCFTTHNDQKIVNYTTDVTFKNLSEDEIDYYVNNYHPMDKAGAYGIQEWIGLIGITEIKGSYFNVVGLPTHLVYETLRAMVSS